MELLPIVIGASVINLGVALALRRWRPRLYCRSLGVALTLITLPVGFVIYSYLSWRMALPFVTAGVLLWIYDPFKNLRPRFARQRQ